MRTAQQLDDIKSRPEYKVPDRRKGKRDFPVPKRIREIRRTTLTRMWAEFKAKGGKGRLHS